MDDDDIYPADALLRSLDGLIERNDEVIGPLDDLIERNDRFPEDEQYIAILPKFMQQSEGYAQGLGAIETAKASNSQELDLGFSSMTSKDLEDLMPKILEIPDLKILKLDNNKITTLPERFGELTKLEELDLAQNDISIFPEVLLQLKSLEKLNMEGNSLQELPLDLGDLKALKELDLSQNKFSVFPEGILKLEALKNLYFAENSLQELPRDFGDMQQLEILDLQYNRIQVLPENFGNLINLEILSLKENTLLKLPDSFGTLAGLEHVDLSENALRNLPNTLANLIPELGFDLNVNPLSLSDEELLSNNFDNFSNPARDDAQNMANRYRQVLVQLYPNSSDAIQTKIENIGLEDFEVPEELSSKEEVHSALKALKLFLTKVPLEHAHAKEVYLPAVQFLLEKVLDTTLTEEERQLTLQKMLTALGDCGTPVNHFLTRTFVFECMDKEQGIPDQVQDILKAMAVEEAIRTKLKDQLKRRPESIEIVAALLHCLFLKNAAAMKCNKVKIQGTSVSLPPFSRNVKFGFTQIPKELEEAFLKLCCQEKDGQLLQQEGKYLEDPQKINAMVEPFLADLDPTLASPRELLVRDFEGEINKLLLAHDLTSLIDKKDARVFLDTKQHQEDLRALLQDVPDDKIQDTYHEFLRKKEFEAFSLDLKYNGVKPASTVLEAMTKPLTNKREKRPLDTSEDAAAMQKTKKQKITKPSM